MLRGLLGYIQALSYLPRRWMIKNIFFSGTLSIIIFAALFGIIYYLGDNLSAFILSLFAVGEPKGIIDLGINWSSRILLWVLAFFSFKYLILIIAGPFMSEVSDKIKEESYPSENSLPIIKSGFMAAGYRGVKLALRNAFKEISLTLFLLIVGLATGLIVITGPMIIAVQAYFLGYANLDIVFEKHLSFKESKSLIKRNRGLALINGLGFLGILLIPIVGLFIAPAYSVAAATKSSQSLLN